MTNSVHMTDEERLQLLKNWLHKHGKKIILIVMAFLIIFFGYQYTMNKYNEYRDASTTYFYKMTHTVDENNKIDYANYIVKNYSRTIYAKIAKFVLANHAVQERNLDTAIELYKNIYLNASWSELRLMSFNHLLQLLLFTGDNSKAEEYWHKDRELVKKFPMQMYALLGDIYRYQHKFSQAKQAYDKSLHSYKQLSATMQAENTAYNSLIQFKQSLLLPGITAQDVAKFENHYVIDKQKH